MYIQTEKLISLVCNINHHLIVLTDWAPQRLYSQRYSYSWRNSWGLKSQELFYIAYNLEKIIDKLYYFNY